MGIIFDSVENLNGLKFQHFWNQLSKNYLTVLKFLTVMNFNTFGGIDIDTYFLTNSVEIFNSVEFQHYRGRRSSIVIEKVHWKSLMLKFFYGVEISTMLVAEKVPC